MIQNILIAMDKHLKAVEKCKTMQDFNKLLPSRANIIKQSDKLGYKSEAFGFMYKCISTKFNILSNRK